MSDVAPYDGLKEGFASHYSRAIEAEDWLVEFCFAVDDI